MLGFGLNHLTDTVHQQPHQARVVFDIQIHAYHNSISPTAPSILPTCYLFSLDHDLYRELVLSSQKPF